MLTWGWGFLRVEVLNLGGRVGGFGCLGFDSD